MKVTDEMVNRFLCWHLPDDFDPDGGIVFTKFHTNGTTRYTPVGTNLLTADQARAMLEHVVGDVQSPEREAAKAEMREALREVKDAVAQVLKDTKAVVRR